MNKDLETVSCPICIKPSTSEKVTRFILDDFISNLVLCKGCGLGYLSPRWSKQDYLKYYQETYDLKYRPELKGDFSNDSEFKTNIITERFRIANVSFDNAEKILDIGSGAGDNLLAFRSKNQKLNCFAIEPSKISGEYLKRRGIKILSEDVDTEWHYNNEEMFDIVIMRHVLEHFMDPLKVLSKVRSVLKTDGVLYIAVPNNLLENRNEGWLRVAHTYYFNEFTLNAILSKSGFFVNQSILEDKFNKHEVVFFASKNMILNKNITENSYSKQMSVFKKVLKKDGIISKKGFIYKVKRKLKKIFKE